MPIDQTIVDVQIKALGDVHQWYGKKKVKHAIPGWSQSPPIACCFWTNGCFGLKQAELPLDQIIAVVHRSGFLSGKLLMATTSGQKDVTKIRKLKWRRSPRSSRRLCAVHTILRKRTSPINSSGWRR